MNRKLVVSVFGLSCVLWGAPEDLLAVSGLSGRPGGRVVYTQRTEPRTFNPIFATEAASREVIQRLMADLVHINRETLKTEPALAKSWSASKDGHRYIVELRQGLRFSDGHPFTADDVVFTFQAMADEKLNSPQRGLLILDGKPIIANKLDQYKVAFDLPRPYAAAERLFDGFAILPRHLLEQPYREGKLREAWGLGTTPAAIAGLGPFRLKEYVAGQRVVLERNPYYWKADSSGNRLPYLAELVFALAGTEDMQVLRFRSGEADIINRISAKSYAALAPDAERRGYTLQNAGPGFESIFLFFNLNDLPANASRTLAASQTWFRRKNFRQAVSAALNRDDMARLVFMGHAVPLGSPVPPGNRVWLNTTIPRPVRSVDRAKALLSADGFKRLADGGLVDQEGRRVQFTIAFGGNNPDRQQLATIIQDDLAALGMKVELAPLELRSLLGRIQETYDYEACLVSLPEADADPNVDMSIWLTGGASHLWRLRQNSPAAAWETEIDSLMRRQISTLAFAERKRMFDRVQQLAVEYLPLIPLVTPEVLVGARKELGNFQGALLDHNTLWNVEELYWRQPAPGNRK